MAATGLDALFESDPAAAAQIAEERLAASLAARCVPGQLVALLARRGHDPFREVEKALSAEDCDRSRLRPDAELRWGFTTGPAAEKARAAAERLSGDCRKALEALFALDRPPEPWETGE